LSCSESIIKQEKYSIHRIVHYRIPEYSPLLI